MLPDPSSLYRPVIDGILVIAVVIAFTRISGLRTFSKMSAFDFAITIATGSILGGAVLNADTSPLTAAIAIGTIFLLQALIAMGRARKAAVSRVLDNEPILLMRDGEMLVDNMRHAGVARRDVLAKLREANVLDPAEVRAMVFETSGDVSVLHGPADGSALAPELLEGVRDQAR